MVKPAPFCIAFLVALSLGTLRPAYAASCPVVISTIVQSPDAVHRSDVAVTFAYRSNAPSYLSLDLDITYADGETIASHRAPVAFNSDGSVFSDLEQSGLDVREHGPIADSWIRGVMDANGMQITCAHTSAMRRYANRPNEGAFMLVSQDDLSPKPLGRLDAQSRAKPAGATLLK
jgi:hypothetical protein